MLARMLLHVIESTRPVDPSRHRLAHREGRRASDDVPDRAVLAVDHVDDGLVFDPAGVMRLPPEVG